MKLNGWQRLWIVVSIAWIVAVGASYVSSRGSEDKLHHDWSNDLIVYLIEQSSELHGQSVKSVRSAYSDLSDKQLVEALHDKYLPKHPAYSYGFAEIDKKYRALDRAEIGRTGLRGSLAWLAAALGIPVLVYLAGFAVAWVRAGFRHA